MHGVVMAIYWKGLLLDWLAPLLVGGCIGSFLNVCIYRIPLNKSVVTPGSHCAACGIPLKWVYNIPIFSWVWLRGRCSCKLIKLEFRYPLVEGLTALMFLAVWQQYSRDPILALIYVFFISALIVGSFIDIDHFILPDRITLGGTLAGLCISGFYPMLHGTYSNWEALKSSGFGLLVGGGGLLLISIIGAMAFRKDAMGLGDVKLMAAFGAFLGWKAIPFILMFASIIGSVYGLGFMYLSRRKWGTVIPFGPFLCIAAVLWIFFGKEWVAEYFRLFNIQ